MPPRCAHRRPAHPLQARLVPLRHARRVGAHQAHQLERGRAERLRLARQDAEVGELAAHRDRQAAEQPGVERVAHHRFRQHGDRVARLQQLQHREDRAALDQVLGRAQVRLRELVLHELARRAGEELQHPRPARQVGERQRPGAAERMALPHHRAEQLVGERLEVEAVVLHRRAEAADGEVELAPLQQVEQLVAGLAEDAHRQQRALLLQVGDGARHDVRRRAHDAADDQLAEAAAPLGLEVGDEALEVDQRRAGELDDVAAELGDAHAAGAALEEGKAERQLDVAQHLARARLRQADRLGGAVQVAELAELVQQHQVPIAQAVGERGGQGRGGHRPTITKRNRMLVFFDWIVIGRPPRVGPWACRRSARFAPSRCAAAAATITTRPTATGSTARSRRRCRAGPSTG